MLRGRSRRDLRPFPPAIRPEADGNTQTAGTRGAKRQTEGDVKIRETKARRKEQVPDGSRTVKYRDRGLHKRSEDKPTDT